MNIRFTIEEENIIAIYAEDSRERTQTRTKRHEQER